MWKRRRSLFIYCQSKFGQIHPIFSFIGMQVSPPRNLKKYSECMWAPEIWEVRRKQLHNQNSDFTHKMSNMYSQNVEFSVQHTNREVGQEPFLFPRSFSHFSEPFLSKNSEIGRKVLETHNIAWCSFWKHAIWYSADSGNPRFVQYTTVLEYNPFRF